MWVLGVVINNEIYYFRVFQNFILSFAIRLYKRFSAGFSCINYFYFRKYYTSNSASGLRRFFVSKFYFTFCIFKIDSE